jgi:hypothetical protein
MKQRQTRLYKYLKKDQNETVSGKTNSPAKNHGCEIRKDVFQIQTGELSKEVKGCCLPLALLVGKSFLDKDERSKRLTLNMGLDFDKLYTGREIKNVYEMSGVDEGSVKVGELDYFYKNYIWPNTKSIWLFFLSSTLPL